ncbi:programmed cell death protein 2 [Kalaharituber pfeilii]|nr:programmed cell death protein 2 [Kalaharituber pfeilii]
MSGNYSDSEEEDYGDFTTTNVTDGDKISHLGGEPIWPYPTSAPDVRTAKCHTCNHLMPLLLQLDGEVPDSPHARILYVFGCLHKVCRRKEGVVRAIRGVVVRKGKEGGKWEGKLVVEGKNPVKEQKELEKLEKKGETVRPGDMLFGDRLGAGSGRASGNANPFSKGRDSSESNGTRANPFSTGSNPSSTFPSTSLTSQAPLTSSPTKPASTASTLPKSFADTLKLSNTDDNPHPVKCDSSPLMLGPQEPWPSVLPSTYPHYYLDAEYEQLDATTPESLLHAQGRAPVATEEELLNSASSDGGAEDWGGYEKSTLDKTFQKFADRVAQNPEQVLRYEHKGFPLLYSKSDPVGRLLSSPPSLRTAQSVPRCPNCRKQRVFEFQLMPHAIAMLEAEDWGTIIVYTCTCVPKILDENGVGWAEEWVGVQWEQVKQVKR